MAHRRLLTIVYVVLPLVLWGLVHAAPAFGPLARGLETHGWSRTHGQLVDQQPAFMPTEPIDVDDGRRTVQMRTGQHATHQTVHYQDTPNVRLSYTYTVEGVEYQCADVTVRGSAVDSPQQAERLAAAFTSGPFVVYYDPADPSRAVLVPGVPDFATRRLAFAGALAMLGIGVGAIAITASRRPRSAPADAA